jgi:hypothetical protein
LLLPVGEHCTLRNKAVFKEAPQRNRQLARNRNDGYGRSALRFVAQTSE